MRSWAHGRWEGEALLLVTAENAASAVEMTARWQALGARVATQPMPGDHRSFLEAPHVQEIARRVEAWLER